MSWRMNCWEILGIEATSDKKSIERAYDFKLKMIDIEGESAKAHELKTAFDSALFLSGTIIESNRPEKEPLSAEEISDRMLEVITENSHSVETKSVEIEKVIEQKETPPIEQFRQTLNEIYGKMDFFSETEKWSILFSNKSDWSIDERLQIAMIMQEFLMENYRILSKTVIEYLGQFFDFERLINDYKLVSYFHYTWSEIKQVPPFSFDDYYKIPKDQRIDYYSNRYELFRMFNNGVPDQSVWIERLNACRNISTTDYDVINLQIAFLLMNDFRLEQEQTFTEFQKLLDEVNAIKETSTSNFFSTYVNWAKGEASANDVLIFDRSEVTIPIITVHLLMGYVYFLLQRHSRVKECWAELSKKNPSLFRPEELAMISYSNDVSTHQKKGKGTGRYLWIAFVIMMFLGKLAIMFSKNSEHKSYDSLPDVQTLFSSDVDSTIKNIFDEKNDLKDSDDIYDQFVYFFYIEPNDEDRPVFIEEYLVGRGKELAQKVITSELPKLELNASYDFYSSPDNVKEYGFVTALTMFDEAEPFVILQENDDEKISNIFGQGWETLTEKQLTDLWTDIQVRPLMSQKFFVVYYLLSEERAENLQDHPEYVTANVKSLLEKHLRTPIAKEFESGTWQMAQDEEAKLYTIINDDMGEHKFILSYDDYGRLEHIYGENWETMEDGKKKMLYENAEEEIGVF